MKITDRISVDIVITTTKLAADLEGVCHEERFLDVPGPRYSTLNETQFNVVQQELLAAFARILERGIEASVSKSAPQLAVPSVPKAG